MYRRGRPIPAYLEDIVDAKFTVADGTAFHVFSAPDRCPTDALPGKFYRVEPRVYLAVDGHETNLKRSEARAIASALMGAAAEL